MTIWFDSEYVLKELKIKYSYIDVSVLFMGHIFLEELKKIIKVFCLPI